MLCFKNFRSLRIALSFMVAVDGQWQPLLADDRQVQGELQAVHLVGHEDAILLQRVQEVIDDWDPRRLVNPFLQRIETLPSGSLASDEGASTAVDSRIALKRTELAQFIADPEAAIFWENCSSGICRLVVTSDGSKNIQTPPWLANSLVQRVRPAITASELTHEIRM